ncbi:MAG: hypothetical protein EOP89_14165 [Lysobacteraceae bacterium]|nr:MAG: hypothetical protein EOP89_14165 [Xanthomonadaceae bacterium]
MIDQSRETRRTMSVGVIGSEQEPLLQIDGMLADPERLLQSADRIAFAPAFSAAGGYPGLRAAAPRAYVEHMVQTLTGPIARAFGLGKIRPTKADCAFSIVTLSPDRLAPTQRAPHVDTTNGWQFAILHYLCDSSFGGTAFYHHRATGFETITPDRQPAFLAARQQETPSDGYAEDGEPWFKRTATVDADFNRAVVYRSHLLHSGQIKNPAGLSPDPRRGRLTANIFVSYEPSD